MTSSWSLDKRVIAKCKNLDKIEIIGASDVIEYDLETNIEGDVLYPDEIDGYALKVLLLFGTWYRKRFKNFCGNWGLRRGLRCSIPR